MRSRSGRASNEVSKSTCFAWMDLNHHMIDMLYRERREISLTVLLVNCHDVTGRIFDLWISRQTGMKSLKNGINNQEKNKGLLESLRPNLTNEMGTFLAYGSVPYISLQLCHECYTGVFAVWVQFIEISLLLYIFFVWQALQPVCKCSDVTGYSKRQDNYY